MKMNFEEFKSVAGTDEPELPGSNPQGSGGETPDEPPSSEGSQGGEPTGGMLGGPAKPTMSVDMGPDGTAVSVDAPLNDMEPQEAIELAQSVQGPSMGEELKEVLLDPTVQGILKEMWYGPEETNQQTTAEPTTKMNPTDELDIDGTEAKTDGGQAEKRPDNVYEITPEGLVMILQQQVGEVAALKPDMTLDELSDFMAANEERLIGEAAELLEAMDGEE